MKGVIAAGNRETAAAGAEILAAGGNAADAAVAAAFASFIAEPGFVHLGGSGLAHIWHPSRGAAVYDFFSNHPGLNGSADDRPRDFHEVSIDYGNARQSFHVGRASVAVPGNIFGLCELARDFGSLPLKALLEPAIRRARTGLPLDSFQADTCRLLAPLYTHTPEIRSIFAPGGEIAKAGYRFRIPGLDETFERLADEGEHYLRRGALGRALIEDQRRNGGLLTESDLLEYRVKKLDPVSVPYREGRVLLPPLSSLGGVLTAFSVRLLSQFHPGRFSPGSAPHLRRITEVLAAASEARARWQQWRRTDDEKVRRLLSDETVDRFTERVRKGLADDGPAAPPEPKEPSSTSHLSVLDEEGRAVSLTTTAGESAGYVVPGTGFIPNNMMGEADLHPDGFHRGRPGTRLHTMITPCLVLENDRIAFVIGTGGSTRIRSATLQILCNLLDFGIPLPRAVDAPRVHYEDGVLQCEGGQDAAELARLEGQGYRLNRWGGRSIYFGGAHCVGWRGGTLVGAGDPRRGGAVAFHPDPA